MAKRLNGDTFTVKCAVCEENFAAAHPKATTCSNACRQKLKRWRAEDQKKLRQAEALVDTLIDMYKRGLEPNVPEQLFRLLKKIDQQLGGLR